MTEAHAFLAPSSANVWGPGGCPASPRMEAAYPEDGETLAAREGTAVHWYLAEMIRGRAVKDGDKAPNGEPITAEMIECADEMLCDMAELRAKAGVSWAVEQHVTMPRVHPTLNHGTPDFMAVDDDAGVVHIWDFKFGHRFVDAFENYQLVDYAEGSLKFFGLNPSRGWRFDLRIYQPRSYHVAGPVKTWLTDIVTLKSHVDKLAEAAKLALDPDAPMRTGDQCKYCTARHACPAAQEAGALAMDVAATGLPSPLTDENAALALRHVQTGLARLEALATGLEAQVEAAVRAGKSVGWELERGYGREKWTLPAADLAVVGDAMGVDLRKPLELITPAQARKKGFDDAVISAYSKEPLGKTKLKPIDSKSVRKAFS